MAHQQQFDFVKGVRNKFPESFNKAKVLEIGSLDINGSIRQFFTDCDYLGIDVGEGKGVDLVCQGQDFQGKANSFDIAISCECFEHNPYWVASFENMHRVVKKGGLVVMSCATTGRGEHGTKRTNPQDAPLIEWDYYKNLTEQDFRDKFDLGTMFSEYEFLEQHQTHDLYFYGIKN